METHDSYKIHPKERIYFWLMVVISFPLYALIITGIIAAFATLNPVQSTMLVTILIYAGIIIMILFLQLGVLVGYLKGNAVKVTAKQFPDIYEIVVKQSQKLQLSYVPDVYILQSGGLLNAFATKFLGTNYIVVYSDILEAAYDESKEAVEFVIGHELGHLKRNHLTKRLLLLPAMLVPFLGSAYSRACEYTCDSIGAYLNPAGAKTGLLILAAGRRLFHKVNVHEYVLQNETESGFWKWFAEKISSHPNLTKRVNEFKHLDKPIVVKQKSSYFEQATNTVVEEKVSETVSVDHSKYLPK